MTLTVMPKYEAYKDSRVDWIGDVPSDWEITRLGAVFEERRTKVSDIDYPPLSVTKNGVLPQLDSAAKTKDGDNRKLVLSGDFVINSRSDRKGSSGVSDLNGSVSLINIVLKPKRINPGFCNHLLKCNAFIEEYYRVGRGIVADLWTTRYDEMRTMMLALPSIEEQTAIANFLDTKTTQIDEAITIKEQQIALLNERKQILIQQAVTQGIDPTVPMKDSGVEWIGKIPAHWDVKKIKFLSKIFRGKFTHRPRNDPALYDGEYPFFQTGDVAKAKKYLRNYKQTLNDKGLSASTLIPKGTVVITIAANIGDVAILDIDACFPDSVVGFEPFKGTSKDFLYFSLMSMKQKFIETSIKNTQMNLNVDRIGSQFICQPPLEEQLRIVKRLDSIQSEIDSSLDFIISQIEKYKEYKTTLINSAVTGKIKVV